MNEPTKTNLFGFFYLFAHFTIFLCVMIFIQSSLASGRSKNTPYLSNKCARKNQMVGKKGRKWKEKLTQPATNVAMNLIHCLAIRAYVCSSSTHEHIHIHIHIKLVQADKDKQPVMPNYPLNAQCILSVRMAKRRISQCERKNARTKLNYNLFS